MSFTYTTLKTAIQNYTENDSSEFITALDTIIDLAEHRIYRDIDLGVFRVTDTSLSLTSGVSTLTYTSLSPRPFVIRWLATKTSGGTSYTVLDQKDDSYIQEFWPSTTSTGTPRFYAIREDGTLLFGPTPDAIYNVKLAYTVKPTSIVSASTSWLGTNAPDVLFFACMLEALGFMKGEQQALTLWSAKYDNAVETLRVEEERRVRRTEFRTTEQGATS